MAESREEEAGVFITDGESGEFTVQVRFGSQNAAADDVTEVGSTGGAAGGPGMGVGGGGGEEGKEAAESAVFEEEEDPESVSGE